MAFIDRECVRRLIEAPDPDTALVFVRGECLVLPDAEIDEVHRRLIIARRRDLTAHLHGDTITDQQLDLLAERLDNVVHDLGA
ncbi:hypothetical protein [Microtetraspora sp. NBRC 16547]|uniref:hypothetical protein n=1 Tax=Microtetraspora sp. NBRC 16547 TaxID=3030993 RepID=UPI0024A08C5F|nr:hypothetical protein [Microtetraspora sp. NBRC 16547]GLW99267.1 hypothetical protein Misp02_33540 [Microtetraspora sp. NBRC 16547]